MDKDKSFAVDAVVFSNEFRHSKFVAYKVKDAIVDYFREKTGERPSVRINHPDVALNIHIAEINALCHWIVRASHSTAGVIARKL